MNVMPKNTPFIDSFHGDGSVMNLAALEPADIDFTAMAAGLSKLARYNAACRCEAYSVAQHCVMGADALMRETGDAVLAGYFLLHDGHEYLIGDITRPVARLLDHVYAAEQRRRFQGRGGVLSVQTAIELIKATFDRVIHHAAALPSLQSMPIYARQVREMDERMLRAEGLALFGPKAAEHLPAENLPPPKLTGAIRPWGAMKAELAFVDRLDRYLNIIARG
ncbi:MAG: hypothetical protein WBA36_03650 [Mesorhizobium sp.]